MHAEPSAPDDTPFHGAQTASLAATATSAEPQSTPIVVSGPVAKPVNQYPLRSFFISGGSLSQSAGSFPALKHAILGRCRLLRRR